MPVTTVEIRRGAYYDSVVLMELQAALLRRPGVLNVGVMMATDANKDLLKENGLLNDEACAANPDDLIISIASEDHAAAEAALSAVDELLNRRRAAVQQDYAPKTLDAACKIQPDCNWVLISVPGRYAGDVARQALELGKNVFLYSDNVSREDEVKLKKQAGEHGLLMMGPDCGTAIINGVAFGFANAVRRGDIGLVGASGTGLQQVTARIHQLGGGITHAIGTGGRDLSAEVGAMTTFQSLDLLQRDPETKVIVLISKPPSPQVASAVLQKARHTGKPVIVQFLGYAASGVNDRGENLYFSHCLDEAAELAVTLAGKEAKATPAENQPSVSDHEQPGFLRGLFSGGTLAHESLLILQNYLPKVYSNIPLRPEFKLPDPQVSREHTIIDLGEDEFTVGRPHPMLDNTVRLQRFEQEANDPEVALILLDVVLGHGAHPDPASELCPAISTALTNARKAGRCLEVVVMLVGTDEDPQDLAVQQEQLSAAGARVELSSKAASLYAGRLLQVAPAVHAAPAVDLNVLQDTVQAINVGLASFAVSLSGQNASVTHVDWRPPAGGNENLMSILQRMKNKP